MAKKAEESKKTQKKPTPVSKNDEKASSKKKNGQTSEKQKQSGSRRILAGWICIGLALLLAVVSVTTDAPVMHWIYCLFCGLVGKGGYYALPVALAVSGFVLLGKKKKKNTLSRLINAGLMVLSMSAFTHLFMAEGEIEFVGLGTMWVNGCDGLGGGILGTLIGVLLHKGFSFVTYIILLVTLLLTMMTAFNYSPRSLYLAFRDRPRPEEEEEDEEDEEEIPTPAEKLVNRYAERRIERKRQRDIRQFDLPVDDPDQKPDEADEEENRENPAQRPGPEAEDELPGVPWDEDAGDDVDDVDDVDALLPHRLSSRGGQQELDMTSAPTQHTPVNRPATRREPARRAPFDDDRDAPGEVGSPAAGEPFAESVMDPETNRKATRQQTEEAADEIARQVADNPDQPAPYEFPPVSLLRSGSGVAVDGTQEMQDNARRLADTLKSFGVEPHIVNVTRGPSVTRFELELEPGVKLSKITNLADDIALSLGTTGVRISAIPNLNSVVGIEVPNRQVSMVMASEVIDSANFRKAKSDVTFAVGKDIGGNCIVGDIARLPHLLIAGTTGSGKSVCMNTLIVSLLYKSRPEDVRLIMVDPKMVEFSIYDGIPHLLVPVVKDAKKAAGALQWAVTEMMRRYRLMSDKGVRDLESYNKVVAGENDPTQPPMEKIVVLIDELADLMMVAAKEVEDSICRIAQMGRAAGVHLVIATQRPSANVITGLMKANIPSRIAFAVASAMESRIILDNAGAEKLVGKGDMLYSPLGQGKPKRVQGCFISDDEVAEVVSFIKRKSKPTYSEEVLEQMERQAEKTGSSSREEPEDVGRGSDEQADELLPNAVEVLLEIGQASTSMLQRRLKLGYARAARIMDQLEERGIVGPFEGSKPRQLLVTKEQWAQIQQQGGIMPPPVEDELP